MRPKPDRYDRHTARQRYDSPDREFRKKIGMLRNTGFSRACMYREYLEVKTGFMKRRRNEDGTYTDVKATLANSFYGKDKLRLDNLRSTAYREGQALAKGHALFVDMGCGRSPDAAIAVNEDKFRSAVAVDLIPFVHYAGVKPVERDICKKVPEVKAGSADLVVCQAVLDLMEGDDRDLFYKEAKRMLKRNGLLSVYFAHLSLGWGFNVLDEKAAVEKIGLRITKSFANGFVAKKI